MRSKYHIMQTSPYMYRDKSKDVVSEEYKKIFTVNNKCIKHKKIIFLKYN